MNAKQKEKRYPYDIELLGAGDDYVIILGNNLTLKWVNNKIVVWSENDKVKV